METMRDRFTDVVIRMLDRDPRTAVVLADIGVSRLGITRAHERVFNMGIREQLMISFAAGLALEGMKPIVHSYTPFLVERPFEQIKLDLSHQGVGAVLVSIGGSFDAAGEGRTHQAPEDVALLATLPDFEIHVPGHPDELEAAMERGMRSEGSTYIRLTETANREARALGTITSVRTGEAPTVLAVGPMLEPVLEATADLDIDVLYTATVRPLDGDALTRLFAGDHLIVIEPYLQGTSAAAITAALDRPVRLTSIGVPAVEHRHYGSAADHAAAHGLDAHGLRERISAATRGTGNPGT